MVPSLLPGWLLRPADPGSSDPTGPGTSSSSSGSDIEKMFCSTSELLSSAAVQQEPCSLKKSSAEAASPSLQLSMLAEVRSLVALQDLELFDRLVVHQDREGHQAWPGGLGAGPSQCPCSLAPPQIHNPGQIAGAGVSLSKHAAGWETFSWSGRSSPGVGAAFVWSWIIHSYLYDFNPGCSPWFCSASLI